MIKRRTMGRLRPLTREDRVKKKIRDGRRGRAPVRGRPIKPRPERVRTTVRQVKARLRLLRQARLLGVSAERMREMQREAKLSREIAAAELVRVDEEEEGS